MLGALNVRHVALDVADRKPQGERLAGLLLWVQTLHGEHSGRPTRSPVDIFTGGRFHQWTFTPRAVFTRRWVA